MAYSAAAINFTECPKRLQATAHNSGWHAGFDPITVAASFSINANISLRRSFFRRTGSSRGSPVKLENV